MRIALGIYAAFFQAGCGGSQPPIGAPGEAQPSVRQSSPFSDARRNAVAGAKNDESSSWMAPDVQTQDLLYVTNTKTVTVYSYPKGKLEGTLRVGYLPHGECVDKKGDVFVTNLDNAQIVEYAHGGKKPILVLHSPSSDPAGCAIDPTTGDLAVSSLGFGPYGSVAIYKRARGIGILSLHY